MNLKDDFLFFKEINSYDIEHAVLASKQYFENNKNIDGFIESCTDNQKIVSGIFEILSISPSGFMRIKEIQLNKEFVNVQLTLTMDLNLLHGFIFAGSLKPTAYGWRIINLDYFYPPAVKPFL